MADEKSRKKYTPAHVEKNAAVIGAAIASYMQRNGIPLEEDKKPAKGSFFSASKDVTRPRILAKLMQTMCASQDRVASFINLEELQNGPTIVAYFLNEGRLPSENWLIASASKELMQDLRTAIDKAEAAARSSVSLDSAVKAAVPVAEVFSSLS